MSEEEMLNTIGYIGNPEPLTLPDVQYGSPMLDSMPIPDVNIRTGEEILNTVGLTNQYTATVDIQKLAALYPVEAEQIIKDVQAGVPLSNELSTILVENKVFQPVDADLTPEEFLTKYAEVSEQVKQNSGIGLPNIAEAVIQEKKDIAQAKSNIVRIVKKPIKKNIFDDFFDFIFSFIK